MNYLSIFLHYFSEQRFSEILEHFELNTNRNKTRLELINQLLESKNFQDNLLRDYLYKAELQNFCKSAGISNSSGTKKQIWERIIKFLKNIDPSTTKISKNDQYTEVTFTVNNKEGRMRDSSEMFKFNALAVVQRLVDYRKFENSEEKATKALKNKHPELTLEDCKEMFTYALAAYKEAMSLVDANNDFYGENTSILGTKERKTQPFEKTFLETHKKLNESDLWIFDWIFFNHHLR